MSLSVKIINKRERMPTCPPQETPPESASLSFLEGGPSLYISSFQDVSIGLQ